MASQYKPLKKYFSLKIPIFNANHSFWLCFLEIHPEQPHKNTALIFSFLGEKNVNKF